MYEILALVILLLLSGVFSGSETALIALSRGRVEGLLKEGRRGARALHVLKSDPSRMLITILIGNNVVNIAAASLATVIATRWFGHLGPGLAVGTLTILLLVFSEITPKSLATRYSERISLFVAPWIRGLMRLMHPLVWVFGTFTTWVHHRTGVEGDPAVTEAELIGMVGHGEQDGAIERMEREMIERVFAFKNLTARDVMTPRTQMFALGGDRTVSSVLPEVVRQPFSRIAIFEREPDDIKRVIHLRDLLEALASGRADSPLRDISAEALFVPQSQRIDELFDTLRNKNRHFAVVLDEYGAVRGVITLEDLLEELIGEIYDESDRVPPRVKEISGNRIVVDGDDEIRIVEKRFDMDLSGKPTDTVNKWILSHVARIPAMGEQFEIEGLEVTVQKASHHHIDEVVLGPASPEPRPDEP